MEKKKKGPLGRMMANAAQRDACLFWGCALYTVFALGVPFFGVVLPKLVIDAIRAPGAQSMDIWRLSLWFFLAAGLFYFGKTFVHDFCYPRITQLRIGYVRDEAVKLFQMDYRYCEDAAFGEKYDRALESTSSNDNGVEGIYHKLFDLPYLTALVLALGVFVGRKSVWILLAVLLHVCVTAAVTLLVTRFRYANKERQGRQQRRVQDYAYTTQDFAYGKDIRLYGLKARVLENFQLEIRGYLDIVRLIGNREYALGFCSLLTLLAADATTYGILTALTQNGMSIADFSMYLAACAALSTQLTQLSDHLTYIQQEYLYVRDFYAFMDADLGQQGGDKTIAHPDQAPSIEFSHVSFRYPGTEQNVFTDFSLTIPAGQKLALVGVNGAGKTTFVKLLTGLYRADAGEIRINGVDVNQYTRADLWALFAVVFQDVQILAFSVAENIACKSEGIDRARVDWALEQTGLSDKVRRLPGGQDQMMLKIIQEDGAVFSGGESQKLAIARALYKGGGCVVMDEPTSALDALAEEEIYREFDALTRGRTAIYISHRLASTRFCDKIALIDGDGLREYGTHDELMAQRGLYYKMFETQGKYYRQQEARA